MTTSSWPIKGVQRECPSEIKQITATAPPWDNGTIDVPIRPNLIRPKPIGFCSKGTVWMQSSWPNRLKQRLQRRCSLPISCPARQEGKFCEAKLCKTVLSTWSSSEKSLAEWHATMDSTYISNDLSSKKRDAKILLFIQGLTHANQMLKSCWSSVPGWSKHGK